MVHLPIPSSASGALQQVTIRPNLIADSSQQNQIDGRTISTRGVSPGRCKYNTASVNGQHGVFLVPRDSPADSSDKQLFVPFTPVTSALSFTTASSTVPFTPTSSAIPFNPASSTMSFSPVTSSVPDTGQIITHSAEPTSENAATQTMSSMQGLTHGQAASAPQGTDETNFKTQDNTWATSVQQGTAYPLLLPAISLLTTQPGVILTKQPVTGNDIVLFSSPGYPPAPIKRGMNKSTHSNAQQLVQYQQPSAANSTSTALNSPVQIANQPKPIMQTMVLSAKDSPANRSTKRIFRIVYSNKPPLLTPTIDESQTPKRVTPSLNRVVLQPKKPVGTLLIQKPAINPTGSSAIPSLKPEAPKTAGKLLESAVSPTSFKQEPSEDTDSAPENGDMPFKIESVFSLCQTASTEDSQITVKQEPEKRPSCKYNDTLFVVMENLDLRGLSSVDVRKLRKLTGRKSCSKKCRERTVRRSCRLSRLHVKERPVNDDRLPTILLPPSRNMEDGELQLFERFLKGCKPAPLSTKLKIFWAQKQETKRTTNLLKSREMAPKSVKRKKKSLKKMMAKQYSTSPGKVVDRTVPFNSEHSFVNKAASLLNPGSKPVHGWVPIETPAVSSPPSTTVPSVPVTPAPNLDTNSPAFQKAISALGCKKFFLIRVEGKNILIPVEQNSVQPRAYVLGEENGTPRKVSEMTGADNLSSVDSSQSSSSLVAPASTQTPTVLHPNATAPIQVKTEPTDSGYDKYDKQKKVMTPDAPQPLVRIKEEPTGRRYADEPTPEISGNSQKPPAQTSPSFPAPEIPQISNLGIPAALTDSSSPRPTPRSEQTIATPPSSITSSSDRIRKLKELLRKKEADLEKIKRRRVEEAVDVSDILNGNDF